MAYTKYSLTPASNNAAPPDGAPEGMLPSAVNDTMRDMMSQIRDCGDGIRGGTYTMTAPVITGGSVTGVTFSSSSATITGGTITGVTDITVADGGTGASTVAAAQTNLQVFNFKNRIINGDMRIDQRNAGASVTPINGQYLVDRFFYGVITASKFTAQQNAGAVTPPAGFSNYLGFTSTSAYSLLATDRFNLFQSIEGFNTADLGFGTANAKTVTISFWVYSSLTGTFGGSLLNGAYTYSYPFTYSIPTANTWTQISVTIAGPTAGTWVGATNGIGMTLAFGLGVATSLSGTAGSWSANGYFSATGATSVVGTSGATFYITGVQLEVGSSATGFEYVDYTTQLVMCQRYYEKTSYQIAAQDLLSMSTPQTVSGIGAYFFKTTKRTNPTGAYSALGDFTCFGSGYASLTITAINLISSYDYCSINVVVSSGYLIQGSSLLRLSGANGYLSFSAEL
jgi:hypothetical protein